jgi:hypothetical protein
MSVVFHERAEPDPDPDPDPDADIRSFEQRYMVLKKLAKEHLCHPLDIIDRKIRIPFLTLDCDVGPNRISQLARCGADVGVGAVAGAGAGEVNETEAETEIGTWAWTGTKPEGRSRCRCECGCSGRVPSTDCPPRAITFVDFVLRKSLGELVVRACAFETFIRHQEALRRLSEFAGVSLSLLENVLSDFVAPLMSAHSFDVGRVSELLDTRLTRQMMYIRASLNDVDIWRRQWGSRGRVLGEQWAIVLTEIVGDDRVKCSVGFPDKSKQDLVYRDLSARLHLVPRLPFVVQYFWMMQCLVKMDRLMTIARTGKGIIKFLLRDADDYGVITVVVLISGLFMKHDDFQGLCSRAELEIWCQFEEVVLEIVDAPRPVGNVVCQDSRVILERLYYSFQDEILLRKAGVEG